MLVHDLIEIIDNLWDGWMPIFVEPIWTNDLEQNGEVGLNEWESTMGERENGISQQLTMSVTESMEAAVKLEKEQAMSLLAS